MEGKNLTFDCFIRCRYIAHIYEALHILHFQHMCSRGTEQGNRLSSSSHEIMNEKLFCLIHFAHTHLMYVRQQIAMLFMGEYDTEMESVTDIFLPLYSACGLYCCCAMIAIESTESY